MICTACQEIFKKPEFLHGTQPDLDKYKHTADTQSVREAALINGCQICAMLCFRFDEGSPEKRSLTKLDLEYQIDVSDEDERGITFFYRIFLGENAVQWLQIVDERSLSFIFNIPSPKRIDLIPT
jgi:hypothetical protein